VAAAIPLAGTTAWEILEAAGASPGMRILINGASGGVGTFALQLAHARGLHVTAVVSPRNLAQAKSLGADDAIDYTRHDFTVAARRNDIVLDLVGNRRLADLRRIVRPDGTIVLSGGGVPGQGRVLGPMPMLVRAQLAPKRSGVRILTPQPTPSTDVLERLAELVASGGLDPVIDRRFALDRAADAIDYMETQHTRGKVVLIP
jgi:NADPH:quinone reductase-like Zn-dependent oxidoreductase